MGTFLLIGMGGFLGAIMRYALSGFVQSWSKTPQFPLGTLVVNLVGCLLIGVLAQLAEARNIFTPETSALVFLGFLGAFTTFSTFSSDSFNLISEGNNLLFYLNIGVSVIFGLGAVWLGRTLTAFLTA
ncbi:MAG: fluoride efflux transporter CrcB [Anaerolineales bacterium]|uniref:Fluoride-specific ion channel FluC n=1 Tax=Candidatus Desulfolinea nitratireducens TaxID=2841698 RepID=A0A8J6NK20_9CHLR|nr:fluoride efflux transporter CrcB [Candidatus Desulfolinea nitratireducens]MBL6959699.1 fluoride efflux transporter CrcB [Anaerolineales bacterium]